MNKYRSSGNIGDRCLLSIYLSSLSILKGGRVEKRYIVGWGGSPGRGALVVQDDQEEHPGRRGASTGIKVGEEERKPGPTRPDSLARGSGRGLTRTEPASTGGANPKLKYTSPSPMTWVGNNSTEHNKNIRYNLNS